MEIFGLSCGLSRQSAGCSAECARGMARQAARFFRNVLKAEHTQAPRVITVDKNAAYPVAIKTLKADEPLWVKPAFSLNCATLMVNSSIGLLGVTVLLSNLISNVPTVLLLHPLIPPNDTQAWLLLAAGSTLAGNMTLLGSVANLIVAEAVAKQGYRLSFWNTFALAFP